MSLPRFLTTRELAEMLRVSERSIVTMREKGTGPAPIRIGRNIRYSPLSVQRWLDTQQVAPSQNKGTPAKRKAPRS